MFFELNKSAMESFEKGVTNFTPKTDPHAPHALPILGYISTLVLRPMKIIKVLAMNFISNPPPKLETECGIDIMPSNSNRALIVVMFSPSQSPIHDNRRT